MKTKREKLKFIKELVGAVRDQILAKIRADKIPEEWDGFELRQYIADKFAKEACHMTPQRQREYRDTVYLNNL